MGGNIKFFSKTRRYGREEYLELEREIIIKICFSGIFRKFKINDPLRNYLQPIVAYESKDSFGDCDIIINSDELSTDWIPQLVREFQLAHGDWSKGGNVLSFAYKNFQIDLIITPLEHCRTSADYFAFNDAGNLVGRISHKLGCKYGHRGLELIIKDKGQTLGEILLTRDTSKIHELLNLNHQKWLDGFNTLEEMYEWISDSKYFNKDIYLLDNRNHYSRTRDNKRKTYSDFLIWCQDRDFINNYPHADITEKSGYNIKEPFYSDLIVPKFPHIIEEYNAILDKHNTNKLFKEKFNGKIINELTGLTSKELGHFISYAKVQIELTNTKDMFIKHTQHTCNQMILSLHNHYENGWESWLSVPEETATEFVRG